MKTTTVTGILRGGQLYSLRGAFGESIPPQSIGSPWNDEVWQFVCVNLDYAHGLFSVKQVGDVSEEVEARFKQSPYAHSYFIHNSGAYIPTAMDSGRIMLSCDVLVDKKSPGKLDIRLRDATKEPWKEIGIVTIDAEGISFGSEPIVPCRAGAWYSISLAFELRTEGRKRGVLTVKGNGREATKEVDFVDQAFTAFNWLGFSAGGSSGVINIDNISVKRVTSEFTEWPVKEDFEACTIGLEYAQVPGQDKAKGSDGFVTDRIACSGSKSLEIRDGTEGWAPMVKVDVATTKARNLYCPLLGADLPEDGRTYRTVNWGFVPQAKTVRVGEDGKVSRPTEETPGKVGRETFPAIKLLAHPEPGTMPLFLIENETTGEQVVTTDPYVFVPQEELDFGLPTDHPQAGYYNQAIGYSLDEHNSKLPTIKTMIETKMGTDNDQDNDRNEDKM